jgi:hypothetical protein
VAIPSRESLSLYIEAVEIERVEVEKWFSLPHVRFVGAHTGCSCGFPYVVAEEPIEYFDGMLEDKDDRSKDLESVRSLISLVNELLTHNHHVELLPVWSGNEFAPPKGAVDLATEGLEAERFVFTEQFLYRVSRLSASGLTPRYL